jgi:DNA-binding HxlR family transcriptional regulator
MVALASRIRLEDRECPLSTTVQHVGEWWTLLILHDAFDGYTRFDQFQENLGISSSMLTTRLKSLVAEGLLERRPYRTNPVRHEYVLTGVGELPPRAGAAQHGPRRRAQWRAGRARGRRRQDRPPT